MLHKHPAVLPHYISPRPTDQSNMSVSFLCILLINPTNFISPSPTSICLSSHCVPVSLSSLCPPSPQRYLPSVLPGLPSQRGKKSQDQESKKHRARRAEECHNWPFQFITVTLFSCLESESTLNQ